jgi:DNA-binding NarL/FixJ family response regulator
MNYKVAITDDQSLFREGLRMIISKMHGISVCLEATDGADLLNQLPWNQPDIILLDIEMEKMSGIECLKKLNELENRPKVIMLSLHNEPRIISHLMELGANSYLPKDVNKEELELAIKTVCETGIYLNQTISKAMLSSLKTKTSYVNFNEPLTKRELQVLELTCKEYSSKEIGKMLYLSERTVEGHKKNLIIKFGVKSTIGLVKKALSLNIVTV